MTFKDWLFGWNGFGVTGDYPYQTSYWICMGFIFAILISLIVIGLSKRISSKTKHIILKSWAIFGVFFEVFWRIIFMSRGNSLHTLYPFYPCNLAGILIPVAVLCDNKLMKEMFYVFGIVGGILTYAFPQGIFSNEYLCFPIIKSVLQHSTILFIPIYEIACGTFKVKLSNFRWVLAGLGIHVANSVIMSVALDCPGDYLFMHGDLPFVIPGVPQFITMSTSILLVLIITYMIFDYKTVINFFKKIFKRKEKTNEE